VNADNPFNNIDIKGDYFWGLIGSTKAQRDAARESAKSHGGAVHNITSKTINVLWTHKPPKENDLGYRKGTAYVLAERQINRKAIFTEDGKEIVQKLQDGKWSAVIYEIPKPKEIKLFTLNERSTTIIFAGDKCETQQARSQAANGELNAKVYQQTYDIYGDISCSIFLSCAGESAISAGLFSRIGSSNSLTTNATINSIDDLYAAKGVVDATEVLNSASSVYKGSTVLGHALSKHAGRNPSIWGKLTGSPSTWHNQGLKHFDDILGAPGQFEPKTNSQGIKFLEKMLPDGRGMRLNMDGTFKGFID
jgi:hypothetical protein